MEYAVDVQYFKQPGGDIVVKEMAFTPLEYDIDPIVLLFKAPFSWRRLTEKYKKENSWIKKNVHGLSWDSGNSDYKEITSLIRDTLRDASKVYVIGSTKKKYMERFKYDVIDIMELGYLQVDVSKTVHFCSNHDFECNMINCAGQNVKLIKKFLKAQKDWEDVSMEWEYS